MENTFQWSIIDRWFLSDGYIDALIDKIVHSITTKLTPEQRGSLCLLFSAHSIPMKTVQRGDPYVFEVSATVKMVMSRMSERIKSGDIQIEGLSDTVPRHQFGPLFLFKFDRF